MEFSTDWSSALLDNALEAGIGGKEMGEISLIIWSMESYKNYVQAASLDDPPAVVDCLWIPPNVAAIITDAAIRGLHEAASSILKDFWTYFGFEIIPQHLVVLTRRVRWNHWVVHSITLGGVCERDPCRDHTHIQQWILENKCPIF